MADLIRSIEHVDGQGFGEGVSSPDLTHSNAHVDRMDVWEGSKEADLICSIEHVDRQDMGEGVPALDLTHSNTHVDGMDVEVGFQDADLICPLSRACGRECQYLI